MKTLLIDVLIYAALALLLFPLLGAFVNFILINLLKIPFSIIDRTGRAFLFFINKLTFLGVVHHELSHALLAFITGAKIKSISLYHEENGHLGCVSYQPRGVLLLRSLQLSLASSAPVFIGIISEFFLIQLVLTKSLSGILTTLVSYLILSIAIHMDMSFQDIKVYLKGTPGCFVILFLLFLIIKLVNPAFLPSFNLI